MELLNDHHHPLASKLASWLQSSRKYSSFVTQFESKIRKKLRLAQSPEQQDELLLELETAFLLLTERAFGLVYEPLPAGQSRGPDFLVNYTSSSTFYLEVTRLRASGFARDDTLTTERFSTMLANKLGQLQTGSTNVLLVSLEPSTFTQTDLKTALNQFQQRAEQNDPLIVNRYGFQGRKHFFNHFQRLSSVLLRGDDFSKTDIVFLWNNPQAKHPLNPKIKTLLLRSHQKSTA